MNEDHLRSYFQYDIGTVISWSKLEVALSIPPKTLRRWATIQSRGLPSAHYARVLAWAIAHGYDETIQYDPII